MLEADILASGRSRSSCTSVLIGWNSAAAKYNTGYTAVILVHHEMKNPAVATCIKILYLVT